MPDGLRSPATSYTGRGPRPRRPYAGFGTAEESNARYRRLIAHGATGLSFAFDLPTRLGHDSDAPVARGAVGRDGVAIDSLDDMRVLLSGIPLDRVSTSMAVDAPAALLLLLYQLVAEEHGVPADRLTGAIQNDVRTRCVSHGTCIFPPGPALRLTTDILTYCKAEIPGWRTLSVSGRSLAGAGASPAREIAFGVADGAGYGPAAVAAGPDADDSVLGPAAEARQAERLAKHRAWRDQDRVGLRVDELRRAASGQDNVLYPMKEALAAGATVGEICDALRETWGSCAPGGTGLTNGPRRARRAQVEYP
ncbi:methylmalonyl-CoA mutase family protein [Streptomyces sp. NPDC101151]|uniref:methylmalonyl-CoA mutase family protein n=1 Tax=Streptomyces sp. NPDC101151 TaxID=3366115 RepID=UPI0037FB603A